MKSEHPLASLHRFLELREREAERLGADVAARQRVGQRYRESLARLQELYASIGPSASGAGSATPVSPALSLNRGGYRQSVMQLAELQRLDLSLHEADLAVAQRALGAAVRRQEALRLALERREQEMRRTQQARERKGHDELASQVWRHRRA